MDIDRTESSTAISLSQAGISPMIKLVGDRRHANTLSGITEGFRSGDLDHVVIRISGDCRLIRRFEWMTQILAEVHSEIGEVFDNDDIVFVGHFADDL